MPVSKCCGLGLRVLHSPGNWLVRQVNNEPKPVYKVGFIREKGKVTARKVQQSPEISNSLLR
jgi:hypothetical protein